MSYFSDGMRYEEPFATPQGWVIFACDIQICGREIRFLEVGIDPLDQKYARVGFPAMLASETTSFVSHGPRATLISS